MADQADILRHLVAGALRTTSSTSHSAPPLIAVAGAKGGVGTTTVAVNLAVALAGQGLRTALVDVDFCRADVALHCGLTARYTTGDVLAGSREIHEALIAGPGGIQVAAGAWASPYSQQTRPQAQHRLIDQLGRLGGHVDLILLDVGCDAQDVAQCYWQAADRILLVTTPDSVAIMDAYAAVKVAGTQCIEPQIEVVFNQLSPEDDAAELYGRIDRSCQRFLGFDVHLGGAIPRDGQVPLALRRRMPVPAHAPECAAAVALEQIASGLRASLVQPGTALASA